MAEDEIAVLKEALCNQYIIMKKLYIELEEEREASATAASEALSMILRLQREKAIEKMEACQYKRLTEEKMHHAEISVTILKEIVQQRELEIRILKYQLQAYKYRLFCLGVNHLDFEEMISSENSSLIGNSAFFDKTKFSGLLRRNFSLPAFRLEQLYGDRDSIDEDVPLHLTKQSIWNETEVHNESKIPYFFEEYLNDYCSSDLKQAEEGKESAKVLLETKNIEEIFNSESSLERMEPQKIASINPMNSVESSPCAWHSVVNCERASNLPLQAEDLESISVSYIPHTPCLESGSNQNMDHPVSVHDVYEVPISTNDYNLRETSKLDSDESLSETKNKTKMLYLMPREAEDFIFKNDVWLNKVFMDTHHENQTFTSQKSASVHHGSKMSILSKGASVTFEQMSTPNEPKMGICTSTADFEQVKQQLKQFENERITLEEDSKTSKEQMKLLREIFEQLNTIESHIKRINTRKSTLHDESSIVSVMEMYSPVENLVAYPRRPRRKYITESSMVVLVEGFPWVQRRLQSMSSVIVMQLISSLYSDPINLAVGRIDELF